MDALSEIAREDQVGTLPEIGTGGYLVLATDELQKAFEFLLRLQEENFFGSVEIGFERGRPVRGRKVETFPFDK